MNIPELFNQIQNHEVARLSYSDIKLKRVSTAENAIRTSRGGWQFNTTIKLVKDEIEKVNLLIVFTPINNQLYLQTIVKREGEESSKKALNRIKESLEPKHRKYYITDESVIEESKLEAIKEVIVSAFQNREDISIKDAVGTQKRIFYKNADGMIEIGMQ